MELLHNSPVFICNNTTTFKNNAAAQIARQPSKAVINSSYNSLILHSQYIPFFTHKDNFYVLVIELALISLVRNRQLS